MIFGLSPLDFQRLKLDIIDATGLAKDALHIYAGLAVFIAVRLLWRRRGGWLIAWVVVLVTACGVEYIDLLNEEARGDYQPDGAHWHDIWNTMFWPTVLLLVGRWLQPKADSTTPRSGDLADQSPHYAGEQPPSV
jgi:hypothetical protein